MKKTLLICGKYPLPEDHGANIRTMNFVNYFKTFGIVDIAYLRKYAGDQAGNSIFSNEYLLEEKGVNKSFKKRLISGFIKGIPVPIYQFANETQQMLLKDIKNNDYDYIFVRYLYSTSILFKLEKKYKKRTIIDFDDILSGPLYESLIGSVKEVYKKIPIQINKKFLMNYERKCLDFNTSIFCSEKDRVKLIKKDMNNNTYIVPNIYINESFEKYDFGDGFNKGNIILFIGALGYRPNIEGLEWFIQSIYPGFKKQYPDAKLLVVGRSPTNGIRDLCKKNEGIELHSDVEDVKEYYKKCRAVVVPLLAGSGTRIKILEAAMANTPVLSTPLGVEGLEFYDEKDVLLFENARDFCIKYKKLLNRPKYNLLVKNAKDVVKNKYSAERFNHAMDQVLKVIIS